MMLQPMFRRVLLAMVMVTLVMGMTACPGLQVKDPVKAGLFTLKSEWLSIREYVVKEYLEGRLTDQQVQDFRQKDNQFTQIYNLSLIIRNTGIDNQALLDSNLNQLRDMLLDARRRYYPVTRETLVEDTIRVL